MAKIKSTSKRSKKNPEPEPEAPVPGLDASDPNQFIYQIMTELCQANSSCTYQKVKAVINAEYADVFDVGHVNPTIKELMGLGVVANAKKKRANSIIGQLVIAIENYYDDDNIEARLGNMSMDVPAGDFEMEDQEGEEEGEEDQDQEPEESSAENEQPHDPLAGTTDEKVEHTTENLLGEDPYEEFESGDAFAASSRMPEKESGELSASGDESEETVPANPKKRRAVLRTNPTPPKAKPLKKTKIDKNRRKSTELIKRAKARTNVAAKGKDEKEKQEKTVKEAAKKKVTVKAPAKTTTTRAKRAKRQVV